MEIVHALEIVEIDNEDRGAAARRTVVGKHRLQAAGKLMPPDKPGHRICGRLRVAGFRLRMSVLDGSEHTLNPPIAIAPWLGAGQPAPLANGKAGLDYFLCLDSCPCPRPFEQIP